MLVHARLVSVGAGSGQSGRPQRACV